MVISIVAALSTVTAACASADAEPSESLAVIPASERQALPVTTTEIPRAVPASPPAASSTGAEPQKGVGATAAPAEYDDGVIRYEQQNGSELSGPPIRSLQDFMSEGEITSPLGIELREDRRQLKNGEEVQGLLIVAVVAGSPAAQAGLHPFRRSVHNVLETLVVAAALFMPPAVLLVPVVDQVHIAENYDLVIAVDGWRVANLLDFEERLKDLKAGEIVYLSIIRNGSRTQVAVQVPTAPPVPKF